jgi:hypothetical protein
MSFEKIFVFISLSPYVRITPNGLPFMHLPRVIPFHSLKILAKSRISW